MSDTELIEQKIALRLKNIKDLEQRKKVAREINGLAQTLMIAFKEKKYGKH